MKKKILFGIIASFICIILVSSYVNAKKPAPCEGYAVACDPSWEVCQLDDCSVYAMYTPIYKIER